MMYDAFISYRSDDVQVVRNIVESMMASELKVWFAEYEILIENYDAFQQYIDQGTKESKCLICFLGKGYFASEYCLKELDSFTQRTQNPGTILCIDLDGEAKEKSLIYESLANAPRHQFNNNYADVLEFIGKHLGQPITQDILISSNNTTEQRYDYYGQEFSLTLDSEWIAAPHNPFPSSAPDTFYCPFIRTTEGHNVLLTVIVGPDNELIPIRVEGENSNDREVYGAVRTVVEKLNSQEPAKVCGLHLISVGNHSHASFTRQVEISGLGMRWERKYSISLYSEKHECFLEYLITFGVLDECDEAAFHRLAPMMDRIVNTLKIGGVPRVFDPIKIMYAALLPAGLCWYPSFLHLGVKLLLMTLLLGASVRICSISAIKAFQNDLGISFRTSVQQMSRLLLGTCFAAALTGILVTEIPFISRWLLDPPGKAVFICLLAMFGISLLIKKETAALNATTFNTPLESSLFWLKYRIQNTFSAMVYHAAITLGLVVFLIASHTGIQWFFIIGMIAAFVMSLHNLIQTIRDIKGIVSQKIGNSNARAVSNSEQAV